MCFFKLYNEKKSTVHIGHKNTVCIALQEVRLYTQINQQVIFCYLPVAAALWDFFFLFIQTFGIVCFCW